MSLERILNPQSVAIVGASKNPTKRGYQAIKTLLEEGYEGKIFPVNPKEKSVFNFKCYPKVSDIPEPVDLALICTPAKTIPSILDDCGKKGVPGAVIIASGFREAGEEGKKLEALVVEAAKRNNVRIIGPNTSGMMNLTIGLNLVGIKNAPRGEIAFLSQSGNLALELIVEASIKSNKGFSYYIGIGNQADIKFHEYLKYLKTDPKTKGIVMYIEGLKDGRKFLQEAYKTTLQKPVVVLKSGRTEAGKKSAGSHTGSLAGMSEVAITAFKRAGIAVVEDSDKLFPTIETLTYLPPVKNNKVAILADGGGHATIAADILTEAGIEIPELSERTQQLLREILPSNANVRNPVDVAGGTDERPELFAECARIILKDNNVGGLLLVGLFGGYAIRFADILRFQEEDAAHQMGKMVKKYKKPIICHSLYAFMKPHSLELLRYYNIPVYDSLEVTCECMKNLCYYGGYLKSYHREVNFVLNYRKKAQLEGEEIIQNALKEGRKWLLESEAKRLLSLHRVPVPKEIIAKTPEEAIKFAKEIKKKVALKIVSPDIVHKSDAGGVKLNLETEAEIREAFNEIIQNAKKFKKDADIRGILVTPMVEKGVEVIVGTMIDDQFGPIIMFGLGGIFVELIKDVSFRVLPISRTAAKEMIKEIKSSVLLEGFRGGKKYDKNAIIRLLLAVSEIIEAYPEIREMDLNPVIVHEEGKGIDVVDARIMIDYSKE